MRKQTARPRPKRTMATGSSRLVGAGAALAVAVAAACASGGVRPFFPPLPGALVDTLVADPADVITEVTVLVAAEGLAIRWNSPAEGYLETEWYDVVARRPGGENSLQPENVIKLRFFSDPVRQGETRLVSEAVTRLTVDPSMPSRESEIIVPPGHPGEQILRRVIAGVRSRFGTPPP